MFGIVTTMVARSKGRDGCVWFAIGVLLGPFGFIISLIMGKDVAAVEARQIAEGTSKKCPFCAELIKTEAIKCRHCAADLAQSVDDQPDVAANSSSADTHDENKCLICDKHTDTRRMCITSERSGHACMFHNYYAKKKDKKNCLYCAKPIGFWGTREFVLVRHGDDVYELAVHGDCFSAFGADAVSPEYRDDVIRRVQADF